jgi:hypothetical protein
MLAELHQKEKSMSTSKFVTHFYLGLSFLGLLMVSLMSIHNPQATMDLVQVKLDNNDAISSIRGIYGGVGLSILVSLVYGYFKLGLRVLLAFFTMFWGFYALSRLLTLTINGPLASFGQQWLITESFLCIVGVALLWVNTKNETSPKKLV